MAQKQYGLIIPKTSKQAAIKKASVFENDSEEEREEGNRNQSVETKVNTWKSKIKKKSQLEIQKILEEDPTVYEYDSIYDSMQKEKEVKIAEVKPKDRKPKYINSLLKAAENRKKEYERRVERSIQKEREEEGDQFKDKEAFVTSAYKKKMLEMQEQEEKERKEREAEERMDVVKQKDLSGFYRHLLKQTAGETAVAPSIQKETEAPAERQNSSENSNDNKQSSELIRAKKAVEEMKKSLSQSKKMEDPETSEEDAHGHGNNSLKDKRKSSDDSSTDEILKVEVKKQKLRHENPHRHKKSKHRHRESDSEEEARHRKKHKHSKQSKLSHRDDKEKRDKHRSHHKKKHTRSRRHSSDSE